MKHQTPSQTPIMAPARAWAQQGSKEEPMIENTPQLLDTLLSSVRALAPLIGAHVEEAEHNRRLSPPVVAALREAKLFRMYVPKTLGGFEVPPQVLYRVVEEIARIDGAT